MLAVATVCVLEFGGWEAGKWKNIVLKMGIRKASVIFLSG